MVDLKRYFSDEELERFISAVGPGDLVEDARSDAAPASEVPLATPPPAGEVEE